MEYEQSVIKSLVENGAFGQVKYITSRLEKDIDKGTQFASVVNFLIITVNNGITNEDHYVVVKKNLPTEEARKFMNSDVAFKNEFLMYTQILPLMQVEKLNLFPKIYFNNNKTSNSSSDLLIFENLQKSGFTITKEIICIDYNHIELALKKLAEFHALSYITKRQHKEKFYHLANNLVEIKFTLDEVKEKVSQIYWCMRRGIDPLIEQGVQVEVLEKLLEKMKNMENIFKLLIDQEEPFSVVCHGDFCRNNMFFKYDNNLPVGIKFFDLQNAIYSSPAVDLAFFLYMNTSVEIRTKYWDEFLNIYWCTLVKCVPDIEFTREQFLEHFASRSLYGYLPTCFFVPMLMHKGELMTPEEFSTLTTQEKTECLKNLAGDEGTAAVCEIVKHMLSKNYINKFLELYKI